MSLKAIETRYAGYRFRSRTEARWAVFFDAMNWRWEYEPEGYETPDGDRYLPDFAIWIPDYNRNGKDQIVIVEVKPSIADRNLAKVEKFVKHSGKSVLVLAGTPTVGEPWFNYFPCGDLDDGYGVMVDFCGWLPSKRRLWYAYGSDFESNNVFEMSSDRDIAPVIAAINAARSARFEHGESGAA